MSGQAPGDRVLASLPGLPGGRELLELAASRQDLAIVGGAVRDLLLDRAPRELDVVVDEGAGELAAVLAKRLGGASARLHERFGTAAVAWRAGRIDIAERRAESYPAPGALPEVAAGTVEQDLARRDFTVNAVAVELAGPHAGRLRSAPGALEDLQRKRLRVLHAQSFHDDPTRLLRLARYRARLGFEVERGTAALAAGALREGALARVSRARVGAELRLALAEPEPLAALDSLATLGVLAAIDARLRFEHELARRALELLPREARGDLLLLASLLVEPSTGGQDEAAIFELLDGLELSAAERTIVIRAALAAPATSVQIERARRPSQLRAALGSLPLEAVALAGALDGGAAVGARQWLDGLRHVALQIGGEDLLAAGIAPGPEIGRRLEHAIACRLDGQIAPGREAELAAALEDE